jgi:hypothetical protein
LPKNLILWPLPWKSIGFQILLRTKYVPSLVKIHWRMLILVFTRMLHGKNLTQWPWPWKSIGFQIFLRTKYVPSLVKIHWKMLILECSQGCYRVKIRPWPQPLTLKSKLPYETGNLLLPPKKNPSNTVLVNILYIYTITKNIVNIVVWHIFAYNAKSSFIGKISYHWFLFVWGFMIDRKKRLFI